MFLFNGVVELMFSLLTWLKIESWLKVDLNNKVLANVKADKYSTDNSLVCKNGWSYIQHFVNQSSG